MGKRPGGDWAHGHCRRPSSGPRLCLSGDPLRSSLDSGTLSAAPRPSCKGSAQSSASPGHPKSVLETHGGIPHRLSPARATPGIGWEKHVEEIEPDQVVGSVQVAAPGRGEMLSESFGGGSQGFRRCHFRSLSKALGYPPPLFTSFRTGI